MYFVSRSTRNFFAIGLFFANFQITYAPITCSSPSRPCGPCGIGISSIFDSRSGFVSSAVRVIEIAFIAIDSRPASIAWLFEGAVQAKISFDIPCR